MADKIVISDPKELVRRGLITDSFIASAIMAGRIDLTRACKYITKQHDYVFSTKPVKAAPVVEAPVEDAPVVEKVIITIDDAIQEFDATDNAQACIKKMGFNPSKLYSNGALYTITKKATIGDLKDVVLTAVAPAE